MNTFKRKSLHAAVLAGLGAVGLAGTANAVHVNPDGLGSVLIYPYYTVRADGGGTEHRVLRQLRLGREHDGFDQGRQGSHPGRQALG